MKQKFRRFEIDVSFRKYLMKTYVIRSALGKKWNEGETACSRRIPVLQGMDSYSLVTSDPCAFHARKIVLQTISTCWKIMIRKNAIQEVSDTTIPKDQTTCCVLNQDSYVCQLSCIAATLWSNKVLRNKLRRFGQFNIYISQSIYRLSLLDSERSINVPIAGKPLMPATAAAGTYVMITGFGFRRNPGETKPYLPSVLQEGMLKIVDRRKWDLFVFVVGL